MSLQRRWHYDSLYQVNIWHFWCKDSHAVFKRLEKDGYKFDNLNYTFPKRAAGFCLEVHEDNHKDGDHYFVVWTPTKDKACLLHETSHLVHKIFDYKGVLFSADNSEAITYYHDHLFRLLSDNLKNAKRK